MDLKSNQNGAYLKISERNGNNRNSILIPASGIKRLADVIQEIVQSAELHQINQHYVHDKGVRYNELFEYCHLDSYSPLRAERDSNLEVKERSVYVSNLSWDTNEVQLKDHMSHAGVVIQSVILRRNNRSMGCGIVEVYCVMVPSIIYCSMPQLIWLALLLSHSMILNLMDVAFMFVKIKLQVR